MMKKFTIVVFVMVLALSLTGVASAMGHVVKGKVAAVDTEANTVTVKTRDGKVTIAVTSDTEILVGKKKKDLKSVKKGKKVTIETSMKDGKKTAVTIKVKKRKAVVGC